MVYKIKITSLIKIIYVLKLFLFKLQQIYLHIYREQMSSKKKVDMSAEEIQAQLQRKNSEMSEGQRNGNYVQAQNCRIAIEQLKKDYEVRRLYELDQKQKQENADISRTHEEELDNFNKLWDKKMQDYANDGQKMESQMKKRHQDEEKETKQRLEKELPIKLKQSSELLNLRKMEEHMSKQKNFAQAHKIQERCSIMVKEENENWIMARNQKIQVSINKLLQKQDHELLVLQKKIKTGLEEQAKERKKQQNRLAQKFANIAKQVKMQHDKEVLNIKGHFKSKGGQHSPTKSRTFTQSK